MSAIPLAIRDPKKLEEIQDKYFPEHVARPSQTLMPAMRAMQIELIKEHLLFMSTADFDRAERTLKWLRAQETV